MPDSFVTLSRSDRTLGTQTIFLLLRRCPVLGISVGAGGEATVLAILPAVIYLNKPKIKACGRDLV